MIACMIELDVTWTLLGQKKCIVSDFWHKPHISVWVEMSDNVLQCQPKGAHQ